MTPKKLFLQLWIAGVLLIWPAVIFAQVSGGTTPPAPSYLNATVNGLTVDLNWGAVAEATHYNVSRASGSTTDYTFVCTTNGSGSTACSDSAVTVGSTYTYRVEACTEGYGCSGAWNQQWAYSTAVTINSTNTCTGFTITANKTSYTIGENVNYTWACTSGLATYVEVSLVKPDSSIVTYNTYSGGGQSSMSLGFGTENLIAGNYTLRACFAATCPTVNASATFSLTTSAGGETYYPPNQVTATQSGSSIYVSWPAPTPTPPFYKIQRSLNGAAYTTLSENTTSLNYTDSSSLTSGSVYKYRIYSCGAVGTCSSSSTESNTVNFSADGGGSGSTNTIPAPPSSLTAAVSAGSVTLSWPSVSGATHYKVWRTPNTTTPAWIEVCGSPITGATCTDTNITSGTYKYGIESCLSGVGCSGSINNLWTYSSVVTVGSSSTCTGLSLTLNKSTYSIGENVSYTWNCLPAGSLASYVKIQLLKPGSTTVVYNEFSGSASTMSLGFGTENLVAGTYTLQACLSSACSPVTTSSVFTIGTTTVNAPPAPGMPTGPTTALVGESVPFATTLYATTSEYLKAVFDWGDGTSFGFSSEIIASANGITSPIVSHSYSTAGTYYVRAKAKNSAGVESGWSGSRAITVSVGGGTVPAAPTNLQVVSKTSTNISLKWNDNSNNEDKFNIERKLTSAADWSGSLNVQLQGANINTYNDTAVTAGATYDYRVQACLSGTGCSGYTYLNGVTAGTTQTTQTAQLVRVVTASGLIIPSGMVAFVKDGLAVSAYFTNSSSAETYLMPGNYEMQPSFPGVNNTGVQFSGAGVQGNQLAMSTTGTTIYVSLPVRLPVNVIVKNNNNEPLAEARVEVGVVGANAYAATKTDGAGSAWLHLPAGNYQGLVTKAGFLAKNINLTVGTAGTDLIVELESLPIKVTGRVLASGNPVAQAVVRAVQTEEDSVVIVNSDAAGAYSIYLRAGKWRMYAIADGYNRGDGGEIEVVPGTQNKDISLGSPVELISSSANIVPTVSVTVSAADLGVTVGLPANSLGSGSSASVTIRESTHNVATTAATPLPKSVREVTASSGGQNITTLASAASLEFNYTDDDLSSLGAAGSNIANLKLAYWDAERNDWQVLESVVDTANRKVRAAANHFTLFAIVLPFLAQPASAEVTAPPSETTSETGEVTDERTAQFAAIVAEGTKVYVSGPDALAISINKSRDEALEQKYNADIVARVVGTDNVSSGARSTIVNFVTYGTLSTLSLGAGERGGVVASFRAAYGHLPASEYEWQEVLKIANGRWPGSLLPEREQAMKTTFQRIYLREALVTNANDSAALAIMAYGLRSAKRNLTSEAAAITSFRAIYNYSPSSATDWDAVRAIAYSGAKR